MSNKTSDKRLVIAAVAVCIVMYTWFSFAVTRGINAVDESFYSAMTQRILSGDRFMVDEWHESQFTSVFLLIPHAVFRALTGGYDGIILYMRYVYLGISFVFYWLLFFKYKKYGAAAVFAAAFFCGTVPFAFFTMSYYNMAQQALMLVCVLMFEETGKPAKPAVFVFCGFVFACSVMIMPGFVVLYVAYGVLALVYALSKKRVLTRYAFALERRVWLLFFAGVLSAAVMFVAAMCIFSGAENILENLPNFFNDSEYDFFYKDGVVAYFLWKIRRFFSSYGIVCISVLFALIVCSAVVCILRSKKKTVPLWVCPVITVLSVAAAAGSYVFSLTRSYTNAFYYASAPITLVGCICCLLVRNRDPRLVAYLFVGLTASFGRDVTSEVSLAMDCSVAYIADILFFSELSREIRDGLIAETENKDKKNKQKQLKWEKYKKAFSVSICAASFALVAAFSAHCMSAPASVFLERLNGAAYSELSNRVETGPYAGIYTSEKVYEIKQGELADAEKLREKSPNITYIYGMLPFLYEYTGNTNASYSTWFVLADFETRQLEYWRLHPERTPEYFLVNYSDEYGLPEGTTAKDVLKIFAPYCDAEIDEVNRGYLVHVKEWFFIDEE